MACQWLGARYAVLCHRDDPELPGIVRFKELLIEGCRADQDAPRPVLLCPGESLILHSES
jgi:hypothetical protein